MPKPPPPPPILGAGPKPPLPQKPHKHGPPPPGHHHGKPYEQKRFGKTIALILSLFIGSLVALIAAFIMNRYSVDWDVILPVLAPIWVGSITLVYAFLKDR